MIQNRDNTVDDCGNREPRGKPATQATAE